MSEKQNEAEFLDLKISSSIKKLKEKVKLNKRKASWINAISISLGSVTTLTLGFDVSNEYIQIQKNLALFFSAMLTIVTSWNAFFDYKKLWIRQKNTLLALYQLESDLGHRKCKGENTNIDDLFEEYQKIWKEDGIEWRNIFLSAKDTKKDSTEINQ